MAGRMHYPKPIRPEFRICASYLREPYGATCDPWSAIHEV